MDINFHYFTVKVLATKAGFAEEEAQQIASYSQFVDDFDLFARITMQDVPEYARYLAIKIPFGYIFNPVTTGFNDWFNTAMLTFERNQKWIVTPFHFIPKRKINELSNRLDWRVEFARMDTPCLIGDLLNKAKNIFVQDGVANRMINLMRIGTLLHIFADTYAHQNFSGYWGWENHSKLEKVIDNITDKDITSNYNPDFYYALASIGHTNVYHAPDDSNVTFHMKEKLNEKDENYSVHYSRSNTREFKDASKEIINFLSGCLGKPPVGGEEWGALVDLLAKGFLTNKKDEQALSKHWASIFPDIRFHYSKDTMTNSLLTVAESSPIKTEAAEALRLHSDSAVFAAKSDAFFRYNVIADEIRVTVNNQRFSDAEWETYKSELMAKKADSL